MGRAPSDGGLRVGSMLERAARVFPDRDVVSGTGEQAVRMTYEELHERVSRLAAALLSLGVRPGDRVASFAWSSHRHLELLFAVPSIGAVLQTVNVRFHPAEVQRLVDGMRPRALFFDASLGERAPHLHGEGVEVSLPDVAGGGPEALDYEELLAHSTAVDALPFVDEDAPATMCFTSATTGPPRLVQYSHRSLVLGTLALNQPDVAGIRERDSVLPVVPMYHANAWGLPFGAVLSGARLVLCGARPSTPVVSRLVAEERVTKIGAVPTVFVDLLGDPALDLSSVEEVFCAGSAPPRSLVDVLERTHGVRVVHGWGMTETGFFGFVSRPPANVRLSGVEREELSACQGRATPLVEHRLDDETGELLVRGPGVAGSYADAGVAEGRYSEDGWLRTGDLATETHRPFVKLLDRVEDVIKSAGEWIQTLELEEQLASHDSIVEAAVVAVPHERWIARPYAFVVLREGAELDVEGLRRDLAEHVPRWWVPDGFEAVRRLPHTSTGKIDKKALRAKLSAEPGGIAASPSRPAVSA